MPRSAEEVSAIGWTEGGLAIDRAESQVTLDNDKPIIHSQDHSNDALTTL